MPKFRYTARNSEGASTSGVMNSDSPAALRDKLASQNLQPESIEEVTSIWKKQIGAGRVPRQELMHLSRQLSAFVRAGVPILDGLEIIAEEAGNVTLRKALFQVADDLRGGATLANAFAGHPKIFPRFYVDMLKSAELTGQIDIVLSQLASYIERDLSAKQQIRSALAYPLVVLLLAIVTIVVMTAFVVPRFEVFFRSLGADLPLPTRILISVTSFVSSWWWALLGGLLLIILMLALAIRTQGGRKFLHRAILRLPVVGDIVRFTIIERFCRMLSAMIEAGVPLPEAMVVVTEASNNAVFERGLRQVQESMLEGEGLSQPIARTNLFPSTVTQMVRVGENTGTLDDQLEAAATYYGQQVEFKIKRMTTLFEPGVLLFVGLLVGFVAIAVVSAMYGIFGQIGDIT